MGLVALLMGKALPLALLAAVMALASGCSFNRTIINANVMEADTSFVEVGKTTWREVLDRLGPPSVRAEDDTFRYTLSKRYLRYVCHEIKTAEFVLTYYLSLPFSWSDSWPLYELFIEFDERGVVASAWESHGDTAWRPLGSREEVKTNRLGQRGAHP